MFNTVSALENEVGIWHYQPKCPGREFFADLNPILLSRTICFQLLTAVQKAIVFVRYSLPGLTTGNTKFGLCYWWFLLLRNHNAGDSIRSKKCREVPTCVIFRSALFCEVCNFSLYCFNSRVLEYEMYWTWMI